MRLLPKFDSSFVESLAKLKMSEAATQVVLASLHSHWKLPRWFDELVQLVDRYHEYQGTTPESEYKLPEINTVEMTQQWFLRERRPESRLGSGAMVRHISEPKHNDELPDHFGQIYFELAEVCISAFEQKIK